MSVDIFNLPALSTYVIVALTATCIKNVKFKIIKIRTGCQYVCYIYSENLNWAAHCSTGCGLDIAALDSPVNWNAFYYCVFAAQTWFDLAFPKNTYLYYLLINTAQCFWKTINCIATPSHLDLFMPNWFKWLSPCYPTIFWVHNVTVFLCIIWNLIMSLLFTIQLLLVYVDVYDSAVHLVINSSCMAFWWFLS